MHRLGAALALALLLGAGAASALEVPPAPQPGARWGYVSDFAGVLSPAQRDALEVKCKALDASDSTQVAVVILKSLEGDSLEAFSIRLAQGWGIGRKGKNNGVLLLVAVDDHKMRIEVGYGLEGRLTDAISEEIQRNIIRPPFKAGDYAGGLDAGVSAIQAVVKGEYRTTVANSSQSTELPPWVVILLVFAFILMILILARKSRRYTLGGGRRGIGWTSSSGSWGASSGGSSFGGFGGGSFGGGGASGSW